MLLSNAASAQKKYQSLLWEISDNGLEKPSYLYGTMHVSNKVAFYLGDPFYEALESVDQVALEMNPEEWFDSVLGGDVMNNLFRTMGAGGYYGRRNGNQFEKRMVPENNDMILIQSLFRSDPEMINSLLFRFQDPSGNFEENTWLDMFIYQCAGKLNKETLGLETFDHSMSLMEKAMKESRDEVNKNTPRDFDYSDQIKMQQEIEDAYRKGDLDLLDSLSEMTTAASFKQYILIERNHNFVAGMDTLMHQGALFTGVGAAHLPGEEGCIELLRELGYSVKPIARGGRDDKRTDKLSDLSVNRPLNNYESPNGQISFTTPYNAYGISTSARANGYLSMDITNGLTFTCDRFMTQAPFENKSKVQQKAELAELLYEVIPGDIMKQKDVEKYGMVGFDILHKSGRGDYKRSMILYSDYEVFVCRLSGSGSKIKKGAGEHFFTSLMIQPNSHLSSQVVSDINRSFTVDMPGTLTSYCLFANETRISDDYLSQTVDQDGDIYHMYEFNAIDYSLIEDEEYLLKQVALAFEEDSDEDIVSEKYGKLKGFKILDVNHGEYFGKPAHARYLISGEKIYVMQHFGENESGRTAFFNSLELHVPKYEETFELVDSAGFFKSRLPYEFEESSMSGMLGFSMYGSNEKDPTSEYNYSSSLVPPGTSDGIDVEYYRYPKYNVMGDWDDYFKETDEYTTLDKDLVVDSRDVEKTERGFIMNQVLSDSLSDIKFATHAILDLNRVITVRCAYDSKLGLSPLFNDFIENLEIMEDTNATDFMISFDKKLLVDLQGEDTVLYRSARDFVSGYYEYYEDDNQFDFYKKLQDNPPKLADSDDLELFKKRYNKLRFEDGSDEMINTLATEYLANQDSAVFQMEILATLLRFKTTKASDKLVELVVNEPPIGISTSVHQGFFRFMDENLELAASMYPDLLELIDYDEYKEPVLLTLSMLVDSAAIKPSAYASKVDYLVKQTKLKTKRDVSTGLEFESDSYTWHNDMTLDRYWNLLYPHKSNPEVQQLFKSIEDGDKAELKKTYFQYIHHMGEAVDEGQIKNLLSLDDDIKDYEFLDAVGRTDLAKKDLDWPRLYVSSNIESQWGSGDNSWNNTKVDSVTFVSKGTDKIRTHEFDTYVFKSLETVKDEEPEWKVNIVMVDKKTSMPDFHVLRKSETLEEDEDDAEEQIESLIGELISSTRNYPFNYSHYDDEYMEY
jgi:uncharacterized protein YbaP (TraB family)